MSGPLDELRSAIEQGTALVLVGAGVSIGATKGQLVQVGKKKLALPVFRAVGIGWFAVNCFSAMTYGGRLAILFTGRRSLRSSDLR